MADELDEFGIPIRKKKAEAKTQASADVDEFGIPIKKKTISEPLKTSSPTSSTTSETNYPVGSLPEAGRVQNNQFGFPSTTLPFAGDEQTIPATQLEDVSVSAPQLPQFKLSPERLAQIDAAYGGDRNELNTARKSASGDSGTITTYKPDEAPIANRAKYLYNKLLQGVGSVASGLGDVALQGASVMSTGATGTGDVPLNLYRQQIAPDIRNYLKETIGSEKGKEREGQYNRETFTGALGGLAQSVPAMAATAVSGGVGGGAMFLQSYDNALESIDQSEAGRNLDDVTKTIFATTVGTVTSALEKYGFDKIFKGETGVISNLIAQRALKNASKETGEKVTGDVLSRFLDKELVNLSNKFVKGGAKALDGALIEYGTEALQEGAQAGAEILTNKLTGKPVFDISETSKWDGFLARMNKAGVAGAIGGGLLGGVAGLANLSKGDVVKQEQQITDIDNALANESLSDASREVLVQRKIDLQNQLEETAGKIDEAYDKLDDKQKEEVNGIVEQKVKLQEAIADPALSEDIKKSLETQSEDLDKQLSEIKPVEGSKEPKPIENTAQTKEVVTEPKTASNEETSQVTEQQVPKAEEAVAKAGEEILDDVQPKIGDDVEYNLNGEVFKGKLKAITPNDKYVVTKPDGTDYITSTLQNFKPISEVVASEPQTNKNIVEEAYKSNKEIESVGDTKQYENYVKSIFPESQTKEPMYHGSPNEFENFDLGKLGENSKNTGYFGEGLYFTPKKSMADAYGDKTYRVVLDTKNPFKKTAKNFEDLYERLKDLGMDKKYFDGRALALITQAYPQHSKRITQAIKDMGYDSVVDWNETIVFDPKQVHILGTKNDANNFKQFVDGNKVQSEKPKYTIKGEKVTPKDRNVSSEDLNKIGKAFSDRFGIGYEVISKDRANQILNLRSKKDIFFQILDDVDIFKNKNIEDSKSFVEKVFSTVESAAEAKSAYKRLAGKFHPDRDGGSNEIMQYLNNAKDKYDKGGYKKTGNMYKDPIFKTYADHMNDLRNWANKKTKDFRDDLSPEDLKRFEEERMAFEKSKKTLKDNRNSAIEKINNKLKSDLEEIRDYVKSRKESIRKRTDISEYKKGDILSDVDYKRSELEETYRNKAEEQMDAINNKLDDDLDKLGSDFDNKWSFQKKGDRIGGFYDKANKKAYLVEGVADETTAIHEMFSHPFISAIEAEHPELFKNILNEAKNDNQIKEYVDANYGELEGLDRNHEYIAAAIDLESRNQLKNKSLIEYINQFWKIIKDNISTIFGGKKVTGFDKNTKIKDIVDFILNSDESIDLNPQVQTEKVTQEPQKEVSGIKKALVSDDIIESVNLDKISDKAMQELGKELIDTGEINPKAIVDEIAGIKKGKGVEAVDGSKRALQPKEVVALIHYKTTLDNKRRELLTESNKLAAEGKSTATIDAELSRLMDDINAYDTMAVITAQQQSLAFRLRKGLLDKDYNLVTQIEQYKKVNGGEIPADVLRKFQELDKELTELKQKIAEAEKKAQDAMEQKAIDNIVQDVERSAKTRKSTLSPTEQARKKELAKKYRVFNDISRMVTLIAEKDFREYARLVLKEAKGDFQAFAVEILKTLGVDAKKYLPKLYNELGGKGKVDMEDLIEKPFVKDGELVIPNAYIRDLVNEGIKDINKLSEEVLKVVEKDLPDATLRQVRDAITKYGREVNQTADEVTRSINEAKRLGRLYSQLEDLANQKKKAKTAKKSNEISKEEKELKRQVKLLEDRLPKTQDEIDIAEQRRVNSAIAATERSIVDTQERITNGELEREVNNVPETPELAEARERLKEEQAKLRELQENAGIIEKRRTEARKKQLAKFIKEKQDRLANKNFAPREKAKPIVEDAELQALQVEANRVRNEYDEAHYQNEQENRPKSQKIYDAAIGWGTGIQRTLQAGLDASAFGVQGVISIMSQNPIKTAQAIAESWKFLKSEKYEAEYFNVLKAAPDFNEMKESGLALNYPNSKLGTRDYQLQGSEINKIWKYLVATPFKAFGQNTYERVLAFNPYRATERSFTGAIDTLRVQMFREFTNLLKQDGITFESNPEQYKLAATTVNNMTFRGRLRSLEPIAKELAVVFFAPRKIAATLAMTNPYYWGDMWVKSPIVAKRATLKMASFIGLATTLALTIKAFRDDEEDSNPDMLNPISPDFMKAKIGNTRLDFFGGLNQNVILFSRMVTNEYKTSTSSKISKLGENSFVPTRAELGARFLTNKFAPTASLLYKWADQGAGRQIDWDDEALKGITPIWTQNIKELYKEHPATMATFLTSLAFFGQNMSTYGGADFLEKPKDDLIKDLFIKKGASFSDKTRSSIEVIDPNTAEKRGITKDEFTEYKKVYGDFIKDEVKSKYKDLEQMPIEDFEKEMKKIKSNATEAAKESISGIDEDMLKIRDGNDIYKLDADELKQRIELNKEFEKKHASTKEKYVNFFINKKRLPRDVAIRMADKKMKSLANSYSRDKMLKDIVKKQ